MKFLASRLFFDTHANIHYLRATKLMQVRLQSKLLNGSVERLANGHGSQGMWHWTGIIISED